MAENNFGRPSLFFDIRQLDFLNGFADAVDGVRVPDRSSALQSAEEASSFCSRLHRRFRRLGRSAP
jgi:hypothetical protein